MSSQNIYQSTFPPLLFRELVLQCPDAMFAKPDHVKVMHRLVAMRELRQQTLMKQAGSLNGATAQRVDLSAECELINKVLEEVGGR